MKENAERGSRPGYLSLVIALGPGQFSAARGVLFTAGLLAPSQHCSLDAGVLPPERRRPKVSLALPDVPWEWEFSPGVGGHSQVRSGHVCKR